MASGTFPRARWRVEIQGLAAQDFDGSNIHPKPYGLFLTFPRIGRVASRMTFFPWHKVIRAYEISPDERGNSVEMEKE